MTKDVSIVLAHGAWADGSSWAKVIAALKDDAVNVSAAPLPLRSLADDVAALNRSLDRTEGPIVLAGHAYAGAVIALARPERVKALVSVTALAPDEGEKVADVFYRLPPHAQAPKLAPDSNGLIWLPESAFALLRDRKVDALAFPRDQLIAFAELLPGARVLTKGYGVNRVGIAVAKGSSGLLSYLSDFAAEAKTTGLLRRAIERGNLDGFDVATA